MGRTKSIPSTSTSLVEAWEKGGEIEVTRYAVRKYARVLDMTDSGRDIKPLASGMFEAIDRLKALEDAEAARAGATPLDQILNGGADG